MSDGVVVSEPVTDIAEKILPFPLPNHGTYRISREVLATMPKATMGELFEALHLRAETLDKSFTFTSEYDVVAQALYIRWSPSDAG